MLIPSEYNYTFNQTILPPDLIELKEHIRLLHGDTSEDTLLLSYYNAAVELCSRTVNYPLGGTSIGQAFLVDFIEQPGNMFMGYPGSVVPDNGYARQQGLNYSRGLQQIRLKVPHIDPTSIQVEYVNNDNTTVTIANSNFFVQKINETTCYIRHKDDEWPTLTNKNSIMYPVTVSFAYGKPITDDIKVAIYEMVTKIYEHRGDSSFVLNMVMSPSIVPDTVKLMLMRHVVILQGK
jgi:hypothetical protein